MYKKGTIVRSITNISYLTKEKNYEVIDNLNSENMLCSHPIIIIDDTCNKIQLRIHDVISLEEIRDNKIKGLIK